jgi:hypothetical protein
MDTGLQLLAMINWYTKTQKLSRIIDCLKFCGNRKIYLQGHESEKSLNRGVFSDFVNEITKLDSRLNKHLQASKVLKYTSAANQNELLHCIYGVYRAALQENINKAMFLSVQAD